MTAPTPSRVAVIGQGYVGIPAAHAAVHGGYDVVGYDISQDKIDALTVGRSPIDDITDIDLLDMLGTGRYHPTSNPERLAGFDIAIVTVPTPLREGRPDLTAVLSAAEAIAPHLSPGALVVLESTVAPGTTAGEFRQALEAGSELRAGEGGFRLAFSPERIDPGNSFWHFRNAPKLVGGIDLASTEAAGAFYGGICDTVVRCANPATAEMAKLLENTYRHVNIALVNELGRHAHHLGVDIWNVIDAAATKPYGFQPFYPGPGVGGHCLPVDPAYLSDRVERSLHRPFDFVDLAMRVNQAQPGYVVERAVALLNSIGQAMSHATVLVLGIAYKPGTGDMRETPAEQIIEMLRDWGGSVMVCDPHALPVGDELAERWPDVKVVRVTDVADAAAAADLTLLVTDHNDLPYERIAREARLVLDTRNRFAEGSNIHIL